MTPDPIARLSRRARRALERAADQLGRGEDVFVSRPLEETNKVAA